MESGPPSIPYSPAQALWFGCGREPSPAASWAFCYVPLRYGICAKAGIMVLAWTFLLPRSHLVTSVGVVHLAPGQPTECVPLARWVFESAIFNTLSHMKWGVSKSFYRQSFASVASSLRTFRDHILFKMFKRWQSCVRFKQFAATRKIVGWGWSLLSF